MKPKYCFLKLTPIKASCMALKPTIYKLRISLSDINRNFYDALNLTIAQHPSETLERMMARILAFCINAQEHLEFTKGLSAVDEPDIWVKSLDDQITLWIDVGEPAVDRIKKASRISSISLNGKIFKMPRHYCNELWIFQLPLQGIRLI